MLERLTDRVYLAPGGVNIGVVIGDADNAVLIDTGLNDTAARKVLRAVGSSGRSVAAVITTHGHADHFGGNAFVVKRTGARVFAPAVDEAVLRYPLLQPISLFAGADPPASMRGGFMLAEPSPVDVVFDAGPLHVCGVDFTAVSLKGHSMNQMGLLVDGVFFCADVVLPERVIERYRMPYLHSVRDHVESLRRAAETPHVCAVPGHGPALEHVGPAVETNSRIVDHVASVILDQCATPSTPEEILAAVLEALGAEPTDAPGYYLLHPTVFAYLTYLESFGLVEHEVTQQRSLWRRV